MCNLKDEPWREHFTGPLCMCGIPTPGNDEERSIEKKHQAEKRQERLAEERAKFEDYKAKRLADLFNRYR